MTERTAYDLRLNDRGVWEIYWNIKQKNRWVTRRKSTRTKDRKKAGEALALFTLRPDQEDQASVTTVSQVCAAYIDEHAAPRRQDVTARRKLRAPLEAFGSYDAIGIKRADISAYTERRLFGAYGKVKVTASTVRSELVMLQAALNWHMKRFDKSRRYDFEKPADGPPRDLWMDERQEQEVMTAAEEWPLDVRIYLTLALTYGVRKGAMLDLRFGSQVDFRRRRIDFNVPGRAETRKRRTEAPMTDDVYDLLAARLAEVKGGPVLEGQRTDDMFRERMASIGYGWVTAHVLKHTMITLRRRAKVDEDTLCKLTRTSIQTMRKTYRHHDDDEFMEAIKRRRR